MRRRSGSGKTLTRIILQRTGQALIAVAAVVTIGFVLLNLAPGDPVTYIMGDASNQELAERIRERLGLDAPFPVRYWTYVESIFHGQLGRSYVYGRPVFDMILARLPATLLLFASQFLVSSLLGFGLGALAAYRKGSWIDRGVVAISIAGYSVPVFWSGQLLILFFGLNLGWFPTFGMSSLQSDWPAPIDVLWHLALPTLTLSLLFTALIARLTRAAMVEALQEDYITTARAKGIGELAVVRHAARNALLPVATILAINLGQAMSGAVLTETVFSWPGLGRLLFDGISSRDYPIVLGLFWFISLMVIIANLIADIAYAILDPRVRYR
jgi:ABC-type dipeptide/oligopeptide/nickel transport system permease component